MWLLTVVRLTVAGLAQGCGGKENNINVTLTPFSEIFTPAYLQTC